MSAELAILNQIKDKKDMYVIDANDFNPHTMLNVSNMFPVTNGTLVDSSNRHDIFNDGSCIATYQFNGDATDLSGNYDGTPVNITYEDGIINRSAVFNGSNSQIDTPLTTLGSEYSVSFWFNANSLNINDVLIEKRDDGTNIDVWGITVNDDNCIRFLNEKEPNNYAIVDSTTVLSINTDYHVVVTGSNSQGKVYINGVLEGTVNDDFVVGCYSNSEILRLGIKYTSDVFLDGSMDQVRFFDKVLSQSEIQRLYIERTLSSYNDTIDTHDIFGDSSSKATYQFNGDATDLGGTYDGTNGTVTYSVAKFDKGANANGTNLCINMDAHSESLVSASTTFTISGWAKFAALKESSIMSFGGYNNGFAIGILANGTSLVGFMNDTTLTQITGETVLTDEWYHFAATYNPSTPKCEFFLNSVSQGTTSNVFTDGSNPDAFGGSDIQSPLTGTDVNHVTSGQIDQFRIFNKELSQGEINELYAENAVSVFDKKIVIDIVEPIEYTSIIDNVDPFDDDSGVALYKFDGNALDSSGNYPGVATGIVYTSGKFDQSAESDSTGDKILYPVEMINSLSTASFSIWFKLPIYPVAATTYEVAFWIRDSGDQNRLRIYHYGTEEVLNINYEVNDVAHDLPDIPIIEDTWYHLVATVDSNELKIYVNNILYDSYIGTGIDFSTTSDFSTHNMPNSSSYDSDCQVDQFRIFNRALTEDEVQILYQERVVRSLSELAGMVYCVDAPDLFGDGTNQWAWQFICDQVIDTFNSREMIHNDGGPAPAVYDTLDYSGNTYPAVVFTSTNNYRPYLIYRAGQDYQKPFSFGFIFEMDAFTYGDDPSQGHVNSGTTVFGSSNLMNLYFSTNNGGSLKFAIFNVISNFSYTTGTTGVSYSINTTYHVVVTVSTTTMKIYVDGIERATGSTNSTIQNDYDIKSVIPTNTHGNGKLANFRLIKREVSASEALQMSQEVV